MLIAASSLKLGTQHVQRAYVGLDLVYPISITPTPTPSLTPTLTPTPTQSQTLTPTPTPTPTEIIGDYSSTIYEYNTTVTTLVTGMSILFSSTSEVSAVNETETVNQIIISGEQFNFTL